MPALSGLDHHRLPFMPWGIRSHTGTSLQRSAHRLPQGQQILWNRPKRLLISPTSLSCHWQLKQPTVAVAVESKLYANDLNSLKLMSPLYASQPLRLVVANVLWSGSLTHRDT